MLRLHVHFARGIGNPTSCQYDGPFICTVYLFPVPNAHLFIHCPPPISKPLLQDDSRICIALGWAGLSSIVFRSIDTRGANIMGETHGNDGLNGSVSLQSVQSNETTEKANFEQSGVGFASNSRRNKSFFNPRNTLTRYVALRLVCRRTNFLNCSGRIPHNDGIILYIIRNDTSCADNAALPNRHAS